MMSIETRINGHMINYAHVINEEMIFEGVSLYSVEYFRPEMNPNVLKFQVKHRREDGAEKLTLIIYRKINQLLKKK